MHNLKVEKSFFKEGYSLLAGIDEAGRGPLAGPVVAACVLLDRSFKINDKLLLSVNDSKKLSSRKREELARIIRAELPEVGVGLADVAEIDQINILQATFLAMKRAAANLSKKPDLLLIDGNQMIPGLRINQKKIIKGDSSVFLIAAASIIAKVERDAMMERIHEEYPGYGFDRHKGYGTKYHLEQLKKLGPVMIHRQSFAPVAKAVVKPSKIFYN